MKLRLAIFCCATCDLSVLKCRIQKSRQRKLLLEQADVRGLLPPTEPVHWVWSATLLGNGRFQTRAMCPMRIAKRLHFMLLSQRNRFANRGKTGAACTSQRTQNGVVGLSPRLCA